MLRKQDNVWPEQLFLKAVAWTYMPPVLLAKTCASKIMFGGSSYDGLAKNELEQDYVRQKQLSLKAIVWTYMSLFFFHKNKKAGAKTQWA